MASWTVLGISVPFPRGAGARAVLLFLAYTFITKPVFRPHAAVLLLLCAAAPLLRDRAAAAAAPARTAATPKDQ